MNRLCWVVLFVSVLIGCSSHVAGDLTEDGWSVFESGDYVSARSFFLDAIDADDRYADAYNGLGWCYARLDNITKSISNFKTAINKDAGLLDSYAGLAIVDNNYGNAVSRAATVINTAPNYCFSHDTTVTIEDIYLCRAHAWVCLGEFQKALDDVRVVDPGFSADVSTHEGREALIRRIEELLISYL